jgi:enhancing lycopene biosynthesis protein 2
MSKENPDIMKKIAVLLSGCGVYDGSEIQESVFTLLHIQLNGGQYQCFAPNMTQHHVLDHTTGNEMNESRNTLVEAARIARGDIKDLAVLNMQDYDGLAIPGGFGAAKNLTKWAFSGPAGDIHPEVKRVILSALELKKGILALCMGPTVIAKALENTGTHAVLTVGTDNEKSPYEIKAISDGMISIGAKAEMKSIREIAVDENLKIVTAPCYMMEASISEVNNNIAQATKAWFALM